MTMNDRITIELGRALLRAIVAEQQVTELTEKQEAQKQVPEEKLKGRNLDG